MSNNGSSSKNRPKLWEEIPSQRGRREQTATAIAAASATTTTSLQICLTPVALAGSNTESLGSVGRNNDVWNFVIRILASSLAEAGGINKYNSVDFSSCPHKCFSSSPLSSRDVFLLWHYHARNVSNSQQQNRMRQKSMCLCLPVWIWVNATFDNASLLEDIWRSNFT